MTVTMTKKYDTNTVLKITFIFTNLCLDGPKGPLTFFSDTPDLLVFFNALAWRDLGHVRNDFCILIQFYAAKSNFLVIKRGAYI